MKKYSILFLTLGLVSMHAFASKDQCLAYKTTTAHGFFNGYDVHCIGIPDLSVSEKFQGETKTFNRLVAKMSQLGFEKVQVFKDGEVYFLPQGVASKEYLLAKGIPSSPGLYEINIKDGIQVSAKTGNDLKRVSEAFNLKFVWRFTAARKGIVYAVYKKGAQISNP